MITKDELPYYTIKREDGVKIYTHEEIEDYCKLKGINFVYHFIDDKHIKIEGLDEIIQFNDGSFIDDNGNIIY